MRILVLAHRIPYPPHTGDKTRAFHVARYLSRRHHLTLGFLVDDRRDLAHLAPLREAIPELEFGRLWKPWSVAKGLAGLLAGRSLSLPYFRSGALRRRVDRRVRVARYDVVYVSSSPMAQYARLLGLPVVMDFVDVDSDKWRQYAEHFAAPRSWLYRAEARRLQRCEAEIARWVHSCVLATPPEEALLKSFAPWARTMVIPNGIDLEYFQPLEPDRSPRSVIFTGAMNYLPNIDAVKFFCDEILPAVRRTIPETKLYIVGLNPSSEVVRLGATPGVTVTGTVPDVRPYYARASVCVAPLRIGRGVQNKVLQAMAMGVPVVASGLAQRGLGAAAGTHLHVEDDPARFAARVVELLGSPEARRMMARRARAFVEGHHAWDASGARVEQLLVDAARVTGGMGAVA